jgi:hypothetical protein
MIAFAKGLNIQAKNVLHFWKHHVASMVPQRTQKATVSVILPIESCDCLLKAISGNSHAHAEKSALKFSNSFVARGGYLNFMSRGFQG